MKTKNLLGFFLAIVSILFLTASVSAGEITTNALVEVDGSDVSTHNVSVVAGETITLKIWFTSLVNDTNVRVEAELEGEKVSEEAVSDVFDVEVGKRYREFLTLRVPYELKDEVSDQITLSIEIDGKEHRTVLAEITLRVQRPTYNADVLSINTPQSIDAGDLMAIDIVLKNIGYNDLDDLYLTAKIPALSIERSNYIGDLLALEPEDNDEDDDDTVRTRIYLQIPDDAESGFYVLEVEATNSDLTVSVVKQVLINNDFENNLIVSGFRKTFGVGQSAEYQLLIVNPTDKIKVYRIVTEPSGGLSLSLSEGVIAIQPDGSRVVTLTVTSTRAGETRFNVKVLSGENLVGHATLSANVESGVTTNGAIVVLTIILAIIFLVLLAVLIVLLRKKSEKLKNSEKATTKFLS